MDIYLGVVNEASTISDLYTRHKTQFIHFGEGFIEELSGTVNLELKSFEREIFYMGDHMASVNIRYKNELESDIRGYYLLKNNKIKWISNEDLMYSGLIHSLPRKTVYEHNCLRFGEIISYVKSSDYRSIDEFFEDYLTQDNSKIDNCFKNKPRGIVCFENKCTNKKVCPAFKNIER